MKVTLPTPKGKVAAAGDWHAAKFFIRQHLLELHRLGVTDVLHVGDFGGLWIPSFVKNITEHLENLDQHIWVTPGNHDNWDLFDALNTGEGVIHVSDRIHVLVPGTWWTWKSTTFLSCGGAASIDRMFRVKQETLTGIKSWYPQELITDDEVRESMKATDVDILISHDAPTGVSLTLNAKVNMVDQSRTDDNRRQLARIVQAVKPRSIIHGHYHQFRVQDTRTLDHPVRVFSLDLQDAKLSENAVLVNISTGQVHLIADR